MAFTFFFRDAQTLDLAVQQAMPALSGQAFIHVWDAGCAHGPEPYTLAMLLRERMSEILFRNVRIHATDVDAQFGAQVVSGVFPEEELRRIPADVFGKYFRPAQRGGHFQVVEEIRSRIDFARHDILSLAPIRPDLSLIVCKNVLLHFQERQRHDVLRMFHGALRKDGLLVMEHTQKVPEALRPLLEQVVPNAQVYRRSEIPAALPPSIRSGGTRVDLSEDRPPPHRGITPHVLSDR